MSAAARTTAATGTALTTTAQQVALIDALLARAFPVRKERFARGESGPEFHVAQLWESAALWEADAADAQEVGEDCTAELAALTTVLSLRWGEPAVLDLAGRLERVAMGLPVGPPLDLLCGVVPRLHSWRAGDRWVGIGAGQGGPELPYQVVVAIGAGAVPGG